MNKKTMTLVIVTFFISWQIIGLIFTNYTTIIPTPLMIIEAIISNWYYLLTNTINTLTITIICIILTIIVSYIISIIIDNYNWGIIIYKIISILQIIPAIIIIPITITIFGFSITNIIFFNVILSSFPLITLITKSFKSINSNTILWFKTLTDSKFKLYSLLKIPYSFKALHQGMMLVTTYAMSNTITSQYLIGQKGLGLVLKRSISNFQIDLSFSVCIIVILTSLTLFYLNNLLYNRSKYAKN